MKKNAFQILSTCAVFFASCGDLQYSNENQIEYDSELKRLRSQYYSSGNDIQKREVQKEYVDFLLEFFSTNSNIDNWNGRIEDISLSGINTKTVTFSIICTTTDYSGSTTFLCSYSFSGENTDSDLVFNTVKNLNEYDAVVFSGETLKDPSSDNPMFEPSGMLEPSVYLYINNISLAE